MAQQKKNNSKKNTDKGSSGSTKKSNSQSKKDSSSGRAGSAARKPAKENKRTIAKKKSFFSTELKVIAAIVLGGFMLLTDIGLMGSAGNFLLRLQRGLFGQGYVLLGIAIVAAAAVAMKYKDTYFVKLKVVCVFGLLIVGSALIHIIFSGDGSSAGDLTFTELYLSQSAGEAGGGVIGGSIANLLKSLVGYAGCYLVLIGLLIACVVIITEKSFVNAARLGASKTAEAVKSGAGKTVEAARYGQERYREIHRENVIRRDARREERKLRQLEASFPEIDDIEKIDAASMGDSTGLGSDFAQALNSGSNQGGLELTNLNSDAGSDSANGDAADMGSEAAKALVYANYGRDIIGDGQPGVESLDNAKAPLFGTSYTNKRNTDGVSFDTEVIDGRFDLSAEKQESEAVNVRIIDYDSDEVPFEETQEDRYKSYAHILESGELSMDIAQRAGFAVNIEGNTPAAGRAVNVYKSEPKHMDAFAVPDESRQSSSLDIEALREAYDAVGYISDEYNTVKQDNTAEYGYTGPEYSNAAFNNDGYNAAGYDINGYAAAEDSETDAVSCEETDKAVDADNASYNSSVLQNNQSYEQTTYGDAAYSNSQTAAESEKGCTTAGGKELKAYDGYEAARILKDKGVVPASQLNAATAHGNIGTYTSNGPTLNPEDKLQGSVLDSGLNAAKGLAAYGGSQTEAAALPQAAGNAAGFNAGGNNRAAQGYAGAKAVQQASGQQTRPMSQGGLQQGGNRQAQPNQQPLPQPKPKPRPYVYPRVNLLEKGSKSDKSGYELLRQNAVKLQSGLRKFGVGVTVTNITVGPRVSRYELTLDAGVKVSRITSLTNDIKLMLAAKYIRIEAPIPGKSAVGVEVPNEVSTTVKFRDILESEEFKNAKSRLSWGVGLDIGGNTIICDVAKMPHILVSGTTGSGKSVGINSLIMSVLYRATPQDVRMILVDPKQVEFTVYNGIPHLLTEVVTTPERALSALNWAVAEMNRRYKLFQDSGTRNIKGYNEKMEKAGMGLPEEDRPEKLPFILIIIDELSELMMHAKKDVESCIVSLAQLARAAGIHLVVATQRPSVDVVTGLIKSNIPSRVAFKLPSVTDSRTILDSGGAESLLGNGDMLYKPGDKSSPIRVQGAFLSDEEVENVVSFIKKHNPKDTNPEIDAAIEQQLELNFSGQSQDSRGSDDDTDEYFADAGRLIITSNKASIGGLQRKFKIGFNRAARIMDQLCEAGVVSDGEGTKERRILMSIEEFEQLLSMK